ncbi:MAG: type II toxin-antitoxin system PemK/MazF family toxin [Oscillospiraceae bacterium]|jgi:mRNA interferase MazF|nr:type II toxin-antitoxin system PemK/MazF family toxin [Oscillospiraceae bacterium]
MNKIVRRGEIYIADLEPHTGSEQGGIRPVLIIQNNAGNYYSPTTIVIPISNKSGKEHLPIHVKLDKCDCLDYSSVALVEQIRVLDKSRLRQYICSLYESEMKEIDDALLISVGLNRRVTNEHYTIRSTRQSTRTDRR